MSSRRGRKQNNDLPPCRRRDIQRAFRARRSAHFQALERRIDELQEENENLRKALGLQPLSRPPLGRGPTGQNQPEHDAEESRCQTVSPSRESAGSPSSYASSPELRHSLIAPSMSSHAMTMDVGPPHQTMVLNEHHHTALSHPIPESISILAPVRSKKSSPPSRILPPLPPPPIALHSRRTTSERFIECNFDTRGPRRREVRNEVQHNFYALTPNYPISDQYQHVAASMHPQSYHDANLSHPEWNPLLSNHVHTLRNQEFPESRQFPQPPSPEPAHHVQFSTLVNRQPCLSRPQPYR